MSFPIAEPRPTEKLLLCKWADTEMMILGKKGDKIRNEFLIPDCILSRRECGPGCYVWEGDLIYTKTNGVYRTHWEGNIRPATLADFEEVGILLPPG